MSSSPTTPERRARRVSRGLAGLLPWALLLASPTSRAMAQPVAVPDSLLPPSGPHPLGVRDLWALERVSSPQPAPDGTGVVFARKSFDVQTNKSRTGLWLVAAAGGEPRALTSGPANDNEPRWAPDGRSVFFLSDRGGSTQIWNVALQGGEPHLVTQLPVDVENFRVAPTGDRLLFAAQTYPDCPTLDCTAQRIKKLENPSIAARRYDHLLYRHWDAWDSGRRKHLFVVPVQGGTPIDLLHGADLDAPPTPSAGAEEYEWSADGREVVFQARKRGPQSSWTTNLDLYVAAADGSGFRCVTEPNLAVDAQPAYAPGGRTLAYLAMLRPGYEGDRLRVVLYDPKKAERHVLTEAWDRSPSEIVWSASGKKLYASVTDEGRRALFVVDAQSGRAQALPVPGSITALRVTHEKGMERLVFLRESFTAPPDVWSCAADGSDLRRLTSINSERLAPVRMSQPESLWFVGADGAKVHAWLHPPVGRQEGKRYPLLLLVHGGPQGTWDDRFNFRWNPQVFAGAGYVVLQPDPHGSTGYGQAYTDAIRMDWGGKPYEDLMKGVDHAVRSLPYVDAERLGAAGASYGGYMINWMQGHTDRFRCLVSHDGIFDLRSFYGATDEHWFAEWEFGGTPWENPEPYEHWSPSTYVKSWKTPMLLVQGGKDYRVPEGEAFAAFEALQRLGVPSQLLQFPDETHWVSKPRDSIIWYDTVLAWLDRWLQQPAPAQRP